MTSYPLAPSPTPPPDPGNLPGGGSPTPAPAPTPAPEPSPAPVSPPNEGNNNTPSEVGAAAAGTSPADTGGFHFTDTSTTQDAFAQSLYSLYTGLWGAPPSSKWLAKAIESGDNIWEIENRERTKPAWQHTQAYRDELSQYAFQVAKSLGLM